MGAISEEAEPRGVLLVDKPAGPTSHDVVDRARRAAGLRRVGHTGTLDPFATGLLLLCVGSATRLVRFFQPLPKAYSARLRLGRETDTLDPEGAVVRTSDAWESVGREGLEQVLSRFRGRIEQVPPAYSAKRVEGRRAHRMARGGEEVDLPPVEVRVHRLELVDFTPPHATLAATVSSGTYLRALARDVGRELGCGAHLVSLRRAAVGPFRVEDALDTSRLTPDGWEESDVRSSPGWLRPAEALVWLPSRELEDAEAARVRHGARVGLGEVRAPEAGAVGSGEGRGPEAGEEDPSPSGPVSLLHRGRLVALAEVEGGELQPRVVLDAA